MRRTEVEIIKALLGIQGCGVVKDDKELMKEHFLLSLHSYPSLFSSVYHPDLIEPPPTLCFLNWVERL
jgi:hypothetical protein